MTVGAFGLQAAIYAARLDPTLNAIVADTNDAARALYETMLRRRSGEPVFVAPLLEDDRSIVAMFCGKLVLEQCFGDAARASFDAIAHQDLMLGTSPQKSIVAIDQQIIDTLRDAVMAADALLARSQTEVKQLGLRLGRQSTFVGVAPGIDLSVPQVRAVPGKEHVVVWAPHYSASQLGIIAFAMQHLDVDCSFACAGGTLTGVKGRFVAPGAEVLAGASLIVDASVSDPGTAIALANCGVPVVCASTTGAHEFLSGVRLFDPWNWRTVLAAVSGARGMGAPRLVRDPMPVGDLRRTLDDARAPHIENEPLVSIVVCTYNRPTMLEECLASLDRQQYGNLDIIVVNDAGTPVGEIVAKHSRARLVDLPVNGGVAKAINAGLRAVRGKYAAVTADDDSYLPDFTARLVAALERTGAAVAHSNTMTRFFETGDNGDPRLVGFAKLVSQHLDRFEQLWAGNVLMNGLMVRRDVLEAQGLLNVDLVQFDYEFVLRLSQVYDFVWVDHLMTEWNYMTDRSTFSHSVGLEKITESLEKIFARYPSGGSAMVESGRKGTFTWYAEKHGKNYWEPPLRLKL